MNSRWWEYYAVRYLVGTVVGALAAGFLIVSEGTAYHEHLPKPKDLADSALLATVIFGALGFAYCYVASAPMLTLHATRAHLRLRIVRRGPVRYALSLLLGFIVAFSVAPQLTAGLAAGAFGVIFGAQIALVIVTASFGFSAVEELYRSLASARSSREAKNETNPTDEFVTSYRHLREHGNAIAIVLLEAALAYGLYHSPSLPAALLLLTLWVLPSVFAWLIGSFLEGTLADEPMQKS